MHILKLARLTILIAATKTLVASASTRPADFDIYSFRNALSPVPTQTKIDGKDRIAKVISTILASIGNTGGFLYLAFQAFHVLHKKIAWTRPHSSTTPDLDDVQELSQNATMNVSSVDELKEEQEEIWRVIHNIFKGLTERLESIDTAVSQYQADLVSTKSNFDSSYTNILQDFSMIHQDISDIRKTQEDKHVAVEDVILKLRSSVDRLIDEVEALKTKDVPMLLRKQEDIMIDKLEKLKETLKAVALAKKQQGVPVAVPKPKK